MEQITPITKKFNDFINSKLKVDNKYIVAAVSAFLVIYASVYAPKLPDFLTKLLDNTLVKTLLLFLILYVNLNYEPSVSLIIAIFMVIWGVKNRCKRLSESSENSSSLIMMAKIN